MNTFLLDHFLKGAALLLAAGALSALFTRRSAARARLVWSAAFAALLVLPLTALISPRWEYGGEKIAPLSDPAVVTQRTVVRVPEVEVATQQVAAVALPTAPLAPRWQWPSAAVCIVWLWASGAALLLARRGIVAARLSRLQRRLVAVGDPRLLALAREVFAGKDALLRVSDAATVPLTWGVWRPVIVLPSDAPTWADERLRAALLHEWAHVRGRDCLWRLLASVVCALHWPNPLAWLAARALRTAQEQACDDFALAAGADAPDYASQLVAAARAMRDCPAGALAMAQPSTLARRVRAVCDPLRDRRAAGWPACVAAGLAMITLLSAATLAAPGGRKTAMPKIESSQAAQVEITSKFIELPAADLRALFPKMKSPGFIAIYPDAEAAALLSRISKLGDQSAVAIQVDKHDVEAWLRFQNGDKTALQNIKGPPEMFQHYEPQALRADFLTAPQITTMAGSRAVIEVIREVRYPVEAGGFETTNTGVTLEVEPRIASDSTVLEIHNQLTELKPGAFEKKIMPDSFHEIHWQEAKLRLARGETAVAGGWDTIRPGRQLLIFLHARTDSAELTALAATMKMPALDFADTPLREVAAQLASLAAAAAPPAAKNDGPELAEDAISTLFAAHSQLGTLGKAPVAFQPSAGLPEPRVTLHLPASSFADALQHIAQSVGMAVVTTSSSGGGFVFVAPVPASISERAARITLPRVYMRNRSLRDVVPEICGLGSHEDARGFRARVSFETLPVVAQYLPLMLDAKDITLRDALRLVASAVDAELSVDAGTFHIHPRGQRPKGAVAIGGAPATIARPSTDEEIANAGVLLEVHLAEVTKEQLKLLPTYKGTTAEGAWQVIHTGPPGTPIALILSGADADIAALKAAGIPISSPPPVRLPENKMTSVGALENVRADGTKQLVSVSIEPSLCADGVSVEMQIRPQSVEVKNGILVSTARTVTTNVIARFGSVVNILQITAAAEGKATLIFITPRLR